MIEKSNENFKKEPRNPFDDDYFGMEKEVKNLFRSLSYTNRLLIGLSSPFGTGKTTFMKMSINYLKYVNHNEKTNRYVPIYISLADNEFYDNFLQKVFRVICLELIKDSYLDKSIITKLMKLTLQMTVEFDSKRFLEEAEENDDRLFEYFTQDDNFAKDKFKLYLEEVLKKRKMIIFLDEIDRCFPNVVIKILEQLKYYFQDLNIVFILAHDRNQLEANVRSIFGETTDIEGYLQKFFDYNYMLPAINYHTYIDKIKEKIVKALELNGNSTQALSKVTSYMKALEYQKNLKYYSLRDLDQIIFRIAFGMKFKDINSNYVYSNELLEVIVILVFVRRTNRKLYTELYNGHIDGIEFCYRMYQDEKLRILFNKDFYIPLLVFKRDARFTDKELKSKVEELSINKTMTKDIIIDTFAVPLSKIKNINELYQYVQSAFDILEYD